MWDPVAIKGRRNFLVQVQKCKSFRAEGEGEVYDDDDDKKYMEKEQLPKWGVYKFMDSVKNGVLWVSCLYKDEKFIEDLEASLASVSFTFF